MATVKEIMLAANFTEEQIAAFDANAVKAFETVLTTAEAERQQAAAAKEAAELARRAQEQQYQQQIAPALDAWANEKAQLEAQTAFYRTQAENAKASGFIAKDAPGYVAPTGETNRNPQGQFVAGGNTVPGSPQFMTQPEAFKALSNITRVQNDYYRLYGTPPPDDLETLLTEAAAQRMDLPSYADKKYNFSGKKQELEAKRKADERDAIVKETETRVAKEYAEKYGNNPNVRQGGPSQFSDLRKGVDMKTMKDPTRMTEAERRAQTNQAIMKEINERQGNGAVN